MNPKQAYLEIVEKKKQEKIEKGDVLEIEMPSGAIWKYLPVEIKQYAVSGQLPMHLLTKLDSVRNSPQKELTQDEIMQLGIAAMSITRDVMLNNLIEPKITLTETDESITPEMILPEDFEFFMNFIVRGSQADADKFRR